MTPAQYAVAHWRGQLSLAISALANGLVLYFVLVLVLVALGEWISIYVGLVIIGLWFIWAAVGILRCSARLVRSESSGIVAKIAAMTAVAGVLAFVFFSARDLARMFLW